MSAWRRKALEVFPDLRGQIESADETIYTLWFTLLPRCQRAHDDGNTSELARIYSFAEWCFRQKTGELSNAVAVSFYEHLRNWVEPDIFWDVLPLLRMHGSEQELLSVLVARYPRR